MARGRNRFLHKIGVAFRKPELVVPYFRRRLRNRRIRTADHLTFYRQVMADDVKRKSARAAVGTPSEERWLALGKLQFDYLSQHGLASHHRMLEIGCGNLRAGWRFIEFLDPGNYTGVDISPEILFAAQQTIADRQLQDKVPSLFLVAGSRLGFLPAGYFDVAHAHSVFSHCPLDVIEATLVEVKPLLVVGGFFDFTYNKSEEGVWEFLREDFYYPTEVLVDLGRRLGYHAEPRSDWSYKQAKIRLTVPAVA